MGNGLTILSNCKNDKRISSLHFCKCKHIWSSNWGWYVRWILNHRHFARQSPDGDKGSRMVYTGVGPKGLTLGWIAGPSEARNRWGTVSTLRYSAGSTYKLIEANVSYIHKEYPSETNYQFSGYLIILINSNLHILYIPTSLKEILLK